MPHTLGHCYRPWSHLDGQEPRAHLIDGRPDPRTSRLKALAGVGCTALAILDATQHGIQLVKLPLRAVHAAQKVARDGLALFGGFHQPLQHRVGGHLEPPGHGAQAQALRQAGAPADDQLA